MKKSPCTEIFGSVEEYQRHLLAKINRALQIRELSDGRLDALTGAYDPEKNIPKIADVRADPRKITPDFMQMLADPLELGFDCVSDVIGRHIDTQGDLAGAQTGPQPPASDPIWERRDEAITHLALDCLLELPR